MLLLNFYIYGFVPVAARKTFKNNKRHLMHTVYSGKQTLQREEVANGGKNEESYKIFFSKMYSKRKS